ncbi:hypothetical protein BD408DRAFT_409610 [Parasitella parasitica]|nr:hypothetical protein BD408DRAFT_409610 [Parasitella parasitica]
MSLGRPKMAVQDISVESSTSSTVVTDESSEFLRFRHQILATAKKLKESIPNIAFIIPQPLIVEYFQGS